VLRHRIAERLRARLDASPSLVDEVRGLLDDGVPSERLIDLGLEYRYVSRYLRGEIGYDRMVQDLETAIGQFAKRQMTWFRRDPRIHWLDTAGDLANQTEELMRGPLAGAARLS
jgi:tRNA dimethylallyltransferase